MKNDKNLANFDPNAQFSKICTVICPFCEKYITFDQKKYKEVIFDDTKSHAKYEEKQACGLENDTRNLANFHQSKVSKLVLSWDHFVQSRKCMS